MHGESRERPQHAIVREDQTDTVESLSKGQRMESWAEQMVNGSRVVQGGGGQRVKMGERAALILGSGVH